MQTCTFQQGVAYSIAVTSQFVLIMLIVSFADHELISSHRMDQIYIVTEDLKVLDVQLLSDMAPYAPDLSNKRGCCQDFLGP